MAPGAPPTRLPAGCSFRAVVPADARAVQALVFGILREHGLEPDPACTDSDLEDPSLSYGGRGGWFAVIESGPGNILGTVGLMPAGPRVFELRKMYLDAAWRGRGLGRFLLEAALDEARSRGATGVVLETATVLREAIRLYERRGFRRLPCRPHACRCDLAMELRLE